MEVSAAVEARRSVRGFLDTPVEPALLRALALKAARAATGGNLQPWHVDIVHGASMQRLKEIMRGKIERRESETPGYDIYPREMPEAMKQRRFEIGEILYGHLGIPREDRRARAIWFARNFQFFGAPAAYFVTVDRRMGPPQWADLGMYLQNLMLLAIEAGLATCPQECWAVYPQTVEAFLGTPPERMLFCGVAIGFEDAEEPANRARSPRAAEAEWLSEFS
ncbi:MULTISPECIES: nitroreductase [unclassified Sphingomonas]|uniref:nitroreductase n=1 Tax=unclassified Sphingomonas TaxID=196159 RepID=UPI000926F9FE|nr:MULTISPECIES: nitroreductase [unclassified Sphingomonas]OJU23463.1 MAG: NADH dehydrogenase [Sphingomonas sp. 66-10]